MGLYTDIFFFDQAVSPPTAVYIHPEDVQEESIILHWKLPPEGQESYIQVKPNADIGETKKFLLNNTEEFKVDLLIPGMAYEIAVASVNNGNMSELKTIQCTLSKTSFNSRNYRLWYTQHQYHYRDYLTVLVAQVDLLNSQGSKLGYEMYWSNPNC